MSPTNLQSPHPSSTVDAEIPTSVVSPTRATQQTRARRYRFACASCKSRKVKCNGDHPVCAGCRRSGNECVWPAESMAEDRLREANARIRRLEASMRTSPRVNENNNNSNADSPQAVRPSSSLRGRPSFSNGNVEAANTLTPSTSTSATRQDPTATEQLWFQVGVGEDGTVTYNGPTSRFHAGVLQENAVEESADTSRLQMETLRSQYTLMDSVWLPLIATKPFMNGTGVSTEIGMRLLDIYWTWLHPLHSCVYRPSLIMDLALGGPYCSDFLLLCIFGLAARHLPENPQLHGAVEGDDFIARAKALLLDEMSAPKPAIPTIQGLLILGGRQCAAGKSSEGWLYTGMAIRMMKDIGLHLDTVRLAGVERWTPAETETRKRLYNSAYIWDKTLSLALGRPPSLERSPYPASEILDKFDDRRPWVPVYSPEIAETYGSTLAMSSSTFCGFCSIHTITTDMMLLFSSASHNENFGAAIEDLDARCNTWYDEIPSILRIDDAESMSQSPPPHVVSLNMLYHSLHILLRRPYLSSSDAALCERNLAECVKHSKAIHAIQKLFTRTFPHRLMTYQVSYCIFTAATVEAQQLRSASSPHERDAAASRLSDAVRILQDEASHTPGSGRSLETIRRLLSAGQPHHGNRREHPQAALNGLLLQSGRGSTDNENAMEEDDIDWLPTTGQEVISHAPAAAAAATGTATSYLRAEDHGFSSLGQRGVFGEDPGFGIIDTGAGFVPDAFPWAVGMSDHTPRLGGTAPAPAWWSEDLGRGTEAS